MNRLPEGWKKTSLSKVIKFYNGYPFKSKSYNDLGIYNIITIGNVKKNQLDISNVNKIAKIPSDIQDYQKLDIGDILISMTGNVGRVCKVTKNNCLLNQRVGKIIPNNINYEFCFQLLSSNDFLIKMLSNAQGGAQPNLSKKDIESYEFFLPTLEEQRKIAEILSTVDEKIAFVDKSIEETQTLKKGLMQKLLTEGIGHTEFKNSEIGRIPVEWEVLNLQEVSDFITKGATPTTYGFEWEEEGIPFLRSECVTSEGLNLKGAMFISSEANEYMNKSEIKSGDILMTITGNVGKVIILNDSFLSGNINQHIARIRVSSKNVDNLFVYYFLSQDKYRMNYYKITTGQAYPQISLKQVRESKFPLPSLEEQKQIAKILSTADEKLEVLHDKKKSYERLKKGLMQKLLTGEVRVI